MLETTHRDGHGRIATWQPEGRQSTVTTPALVFPDVPQCPPLSWRQVVVTSRPADGPADAAGPVELVSGGTWFHPAEEATRSAGTPTLIVPPPRPGPTHKPQVVPVGDDLAVFHDAGGWARDPAKLVPAWIEAHKEAGTGRLLWTPALGTPMDYALWVYLGADLFDVSPLLVHAYRGEATTVDGIRTAEEMTELHGGTWGTEELVAHNLEAAREELARIHQAIRHHRLRALVERRAYTVPRSIEVLRRMDDEHAFLESVAPRHRDAALPCMTWDALWMPEVETFRRRFREAYRRPAGADVLLLLPCSARKPYRLSPSHRRIQRTLDASGLRHRIHEVMVTSPLGLVPRELEDTYPARAYDVPVTGAWNRDEQQIIRAQLMALLQKGGYTHIVAHVGPGTWDIVRDLVPDAVHTAHIHATNHDDLARLETTLAGLDLRGGDPRRGGQARKLEDMRSLLCWQFGPDAADALCKDARAKGRLPYVKLVAGETQRGQTTPERGVFSLTLEGARMIAAAGVKRVHIGDFQPRRTSSLFAVGVESADPDVRAGDEVVVVHGDDVRGCGVANMSAREMADMRRGVAVALRHGGG